MPDRYSLSDFCCILICMNKSSTSPPSLNVGRSELRGHLIGFDGSTGALDGGPGATPLRKLRRTYGELGGVFADQVAWREVDPEKLAYWADLYFPVDEGTTGGLLFGNTFVNPGMVGDEYVITKGHFHANRDAAEFYWCIKGNGALILMDEQRRCRAERMKPGTLHYIPGRTAHRVANTGADVLALGACWPADSGHDYQAITDHGFSARVLNVNGKPMLVGEGAGS